MSSPSNYVCEAYKCVVSVDGASVVAEVVTALRKNPALHNVYQAVHITKTASVPTKDNTVLGRGVSFRLRLSVVGYGLRNEDPSTTP